MSDSAAMILAGLDAEARAEFWAALALRHCPGVGARMTRRLLGAYGSAHAAVRRIWDGTARGCGLTQDIVAALRTEVWRESARREWDSACACPGEVLLWTDARYPLLLREIPDAPVFLYLRGDVTLLNSPAVGVVGTRLCTERGRRDAAVLAGGLAASGMTIVSGLARGVDAAAHRAALELPGGTIAVLGTGIDVAYPAGNARLYQAIAGQGLLISEFAPGAEPDARHFPIRNRIISGLSLGVLVIEAALGSGSLITARNALEQNRSVYAVGGGIGEARSRGCQELIRQGALPVFGYEDVLRDLQAQLKAREDRRVWLTLPELSTNAAPEAPKSSAPGVPRPEGGRLEAPAPLLPDKAGLSAAFDSPVAEDDLAPGASPTPPPAVAVSAQTVFPSASSPAPAPNAVPVSGAVPVARKRASGKSVRSAPPVAPDTPARPCSAPDAAPEARLLVLLARRGPLTLDGLSEALALPPEAVSTTAVLLEVAGRIRQERDGRYALV